MVFVLASLAIVVNTLFERPLESMAGVGLTLIGIPAYYYWKRKNGDSHRSPVTGHRQNP
jgi:APA family basic amino acid/polyamine antiporter